MRAAMVLGSFPHAQTLHCIPIAASPGPASGVRAPVTRLALRQAQLSSILMWTSPFNASSPESSFVAE